MQDNTYVHTLLLMLLKFLVAVPRVCREKALYLVVVSAHKHTYTCIEPSDYRGAPLLLRRMKFMREKRRCDTSTTIGRSLRFL